MKIHNSPGRLSRIVKVVDIKDVGVASYCYRDLDNNQIKTVPKSIDLTEEDRGRLLVAVGAG
ncbi:MAG: hypothetical protein WCP07_10875 [bacterium]